MIMPDYSIRGESVFEITDHTTASDWERFISNIEEVLTEWGLNKQSDSDIPISNELPEGFISCGLWRERHDSLRLGNATYEIRYQYLEEPTKQSHSTDLEERSQPVIEPETERQTFVEEQEYNESISSLDYRDADDEDIDGNCLQKEKEHGEYELPEDLPLCLKDIASKTNDFASKAHCLVRWYSLRQFIVILPRGNTIVTEDKIKLVLSSASVALANLNCHVPIFVQTHTPRNHFYQGISEHLNIRTMYEMVYFRGYFKKYGYLSELISLFREKMSCNLSDPITVTIRLNYCLSNFELFMSPHEDFEGNEHTEEEDELLRMTENNKKMTKMRTQDLRTSATFEQVKTALTDCLPHPFKILNFIHVAALWPPISDKVISDSPVHSDLDPAEAPIWTIRCVTKDNCNVKIVHETQAVNDLLQAAIRYAYEKLDATTVFTDCNRQALEEECLKISYQLAIKPEVILSKSPSDSIRKLIALLFYRSAELKSELDTLDQITAQLKKKPSLSEIYRDLKKEKPSVKEMIIRTQISRPFTPIQTPALPQRMFCTITDEEFRLCGAFSELTN